MIFPNTDTDRYRRGGHMSTLKFHGRNKETCVKILHDKIRLGDPCKFPRDAIVYFR